MNPRPLAFSRAKAGEPPACLIDRHAGWTTREACAACCGGRRLQYRAQKTTYFQTIVHDLRTLRQAGIEHIPPKPQHSVRADEIDCDSYRFLDGMQAVNSYCHNYLPSYSWAEFLPGKWKAP